jgi:hypothetical protein
MQRGSKDLPGDDYRHPEERNYDLDRNFNENQDKA